MDYVVVSWMPTVPWVMAMLGMCWNWIVLVRIIRTFLDTEYWYRWMYTVHGPRSYTELTMID